MNAHVHDFAPASDVRPAAGRCRLCTSNDEAGLIDRVAAAMWEKRRRGTLDDWPWEEAGDYWQRTFRHLAEDAVASLRG